MRVYPLLCRQLNLVKNKRLENKFSETCTKNGETVNESSLGHLHTYKTRKCGIHRSGSPATVDITTKPVYVAKSHL
jgi:hypothetical protein